MIFSRYPAVAKPNAVPTTFSRCQLSASDHHPRSDHYPLSDHHPVIGQTQPLLLISGMAARETIQTKLLHCSIYQVIVWRLYFFAIFHPMFLVKLKIIKGGNKDDKRLLCF
jgi:hypothetical protein